MFGFTRTHTFAELEISAAAWDEIALKLRAAGYDHAFVSGAIDMHGIGVTRAPEPVVTKHRPISTNKAPGAI